MAAVTSATPRALSTAEVATDQQIDDGDFVGILYDTILYERACNRLYQLKKYDFPVKYDELAYDFLIAYRLCLDPKFLANRHTAAFSRFILQSKLLTANGVRKFALDHNGQYEIFPSDDADFMDGEDIEELDEDDLSDFDEVEQGMNPIRKNVGYAGPILNRRRKSYHNGPESEGQGHRDGMANDYFAVHKHSQDMISVIIAHLRKRVWYHDGSGGEIVDIKNMGVNGKPPAEETSESESSTGDRPIPNVKGVKKYTRRFNGKRKRANWDRLSQLPAANGGMFSAIIRNPPTDYSDSEPEADRVDTLAASMDSMYVGGLIGSAKRRTQWLPPAQLQILYDYNGVNKDLRLIDFPAEDTDPTFYGRLSRDLFAKYKQLLPPQELIDRHKQLQTVIQDVILKAFPGKDLKVEPYGSFVSGLLTTNSDADFCITGPDVHGHQSLNDMNHLATLLRNKGMDKVIPIPDAMVPIVKFQDPRTRMECDLNAGNNLGVVNSELIRIYTTLDARVKPFLYMIKAICKAQGINDSRNGYLSSYAITWMGIVFLQQDNQTISTGNVNASSPTWGWGPKPVLPKLQQQPFERMKELTLRINHNTKNAVISTLSLMNSSKSDMVHCRFDDNKDGKHTNMGLSNTKSLARLMIEFFEFFSRHFNYVECAISVGRAQFTQKSSKELHNENTRLPTFRVVDPFLHHRNITGTCRGDSLARVWRAFDHSYRMLSAGDLEGAMVIVE